MGNEMMTKKGRGGEVRFRGVNGQRIARMES